MQTQTTATNTSADRVKPLRPELVDQLRQFKTTQNLSDAKLGQLLGSNGTAVNRAFNNKFEGDAAAFEARIEDLLKAAPDRRRTTETLHENAFSKSVASFLEIVRRTEDMGLAFSPAGKGKTSGIALYVANNPTTVSFELHKWSGGADGVVRHLWDSIETRGWRGNTSRGSYLVSRFRDSRRLLVIDNAHRLTEGGRQWVFDFHDATGCPIALVGNPEILDRIRQNDQQFSRIGLRQELKGSKAQADAEMLVATFWPEASDHLGSLPVQVIKQRGHLRALKKQLLLAKDLSADFASPVDAFRAAHTQLVRDYALEAA